MYMVEKPSCKHWLIFFPILLIALLSPFASVADDKIHSLSIDKINVPWKYLSFKGKKLFVKLAVEIELISPSKTELDAALISSPQGAPIGATESGIFIINTKTSVKSVFLPKIKLQNVAWFNPVTLSAMQYVRQRTGLKDAKKTYRFTDKGVFKFTRQPIDKKESLQIPEKWSAVKERFYPYVPDKIGCLDITVPMPVVYFISASKISDFEKTVTICVFNKKEVIYLDIRKESMESIQLDYIRKKGDQETQRNTLISTYVLSLKARSTTTNRLISDFTFVGLQGNIKIYIDPETRIPVQLKGDYKGLGEVELKLQKVVYQ
ncbi:MAG: hypothetical protein E2O81_03215 [Betaproteobacteria bacterium]|nr:MAG: hypothetical protein E2O81_03215 [Betaproteobacteria bacterium]